MVKAQGRLSPRFAARKQDIRTRSTFGRGSGEMVRRRHAAVGRKRRPRRHAFPAQEADAAVKSFIYGRVKDAELNTYKMPDFLEDETPDVYLKNKGLVTIYNKMSVLRRRLVKLMILRRQRSEEAIFLDEKLDMYLHEAKLIQKQIEAKHGAYFKMPKVLEEDIVLLE